MKILNQSFTQENISYWSKRSTTYSEVNQEELATTQHQVWQHALHSRISSHYPKRELRTIKVLDIGTGPGFFAIILAELGYAVTAIDYTENMLAEARQNAGKLAAKINFELQNSEKMSFADNTFDVIVTRNVTWNLKNPLQAYEEWLRVLKPGGLLLNFDANWYRYLCDKKALVTHLQDRENITAQNAVDENEGTDVAAMEHIAKQTYLVDKLRPTWDTKVLTELGASVTTDTEIWREVWTENELINNASTPMFLVQAIKR